MSAAARSERDVELLAPAGGREQFFAALNSGADAVYLGLKSFNARVRADNFAIEELEELVPLAHQYGMRVLVTLNVLIKEAELGDLIDALAELEALAVDAIIVQDLGVARIARQHFPQLRLHASTQLAVHSVAGVQLAASCGFSRVVLARELSAADIAKIRAATPPDLQLEAFCHGSLCYSYSGLCFFSGANDARSGNRGECAYTCRKPYRILNEPGHGFLFSMKDLDTSQELSLLLDAGVDALKIEGRKKDAQYVATVVKLYRQQLDARFGRPTLRDQAPPEARVRPDSPAAIRQDLGYSFSRDATGFFLQGRYYENVIDLDNPTHLGARVGGISRVDGRFVRVQAEVALERFDGLRIAPAETAYHALPQHGEIQHGSTQALRERYENRSLQFSLRELRVAGARVAVARAGEWVEIMLPDEADLPGVGDLLYKTRSADLKRRVEALSAPPQGYKLRRWRSVDVTIALIPVDRLLRIEACAEKRGERICAASIEVPLEVSGGRCRKLLGVDLPAGELPQRDEPAESETRKGSRRQASGADPQPAELAPQHGRSDSAAARDEAVLSRDLTRLFSVFGDQRFRADTVRIAGGVDWFVPRSKLKALKQQLGPAIAAAYDDWLRARKANVRKMVSPVTAPRPIDAVAPVRFQIKIDRLAALDAIAEFLAGRPAAPIDEIIFEPKRSFLGDHGAGSPCEALRAFSSRSGIPIRLALPMVIRSWDEAPLARWVREFVQSGDAAPRLEVAGLGGLQLLDTWGLPRERLEIAGDFTLYALNSQATRFWSEQGISRLALSIEDDRQNLGDHLRHWPWQDDGIQPQAILFKDTPLFVAEACSLTALHNGCPTAKVCGYRTLEVEDPDGERYFVAHESCRSIVYAAKAYAITHRQKALRALGVRDFRVDFLTRPYQAETICAILRAAIDGERVPGTHSANFERRLL